MTHSVEVTAASLFDAAAAALNIFGQSEFLPKPPGSGMNLQVAVKEPTVTHSVTVGKLQAWLNSGARGPAERILKDRLKADLPWLKPMGTA